jgi:hypothetical protein
MQIVLKYLVRDVDRHGTARLYVRRNGRKVRLREPIGSAAFYAAYETAVERLSHLDVPKNDSAPKTFPRGTLGWLGAQYFASGEFRAMDPQSQSLIRRILESCFREPISYAGGDAMGNCPLEHFTPRAVKHLRDLKAGKPAAANNRRKWLSAMFTWAIDQTPPLAKTNPVRDTKVIRYTSDGFHTWSDAEIAAFEKRHPIGTRARLAFALVMFTGARRSDVVLFGPASIVGGVLKFVPYKTRRRRPEASFKPWLPVLADIVAASPCGGETFLVNEYGKPFTAKHFTRRFVARKPGSDIAHRTVCERLALFERPKVARLSIN